MGWYFLLGQSQSFMKKWVSYILVKHYLSFKDCCCLQSCSGHECVVKSYSDSYVVVVVEVEWWTRTAEITRTTFSVRHSVAWTKPDGRINRAFVSQFVKSGNTDLTGSNPGPVNPMTL